MERKGKWNIEVPVAKKKTYLVGEEFISIKFSKDTIFKENRSNGKSSGIGREIRLYRFVNKATQGAGMVSGV